MKSIFEISKRKNKDGRRKFKLVLLEFAPEDSVENEAGTVYNRNGITWLEEYVSPHIDTIKGMFLTTEFLDEERTELGAHGDTDIVDGMPIFDDATTIGVFEKGYVADVDIDGAQKHVLVGEGTIDEMRYKAFVDKLDTMLQNGETQTGSVEIFRNPEKEAIEYLYGYKPLGRIPVDFIFSGYALIGVPPADPASHLLELNATKQKEEELYVDIEKLIAELSAKVDKTQELEKLLADSNKIVSEQNATIEQLQQAIEEAKTEREKIWSEADAKYKEIQILEEQLAKANAEAKVGELNIALTEFSAEEQALAKDSIEAFKAEPAKYEVNSIVDEILICIAKRDRQAKVAEQNAANQKTRTDSDIYGEINSVSQKDNDGSIESIY